MSTAMPETQARETPERNTRFDPAVAVGALRPAAYNPRILSHDARRRLARSIEAFGLVDPIVAREEDGLVLGGHQRLAVATELGYTAVPVLYVSGLTDAEAQALTVVLNNPQAQGQWDTVKLRNLLSDLDAFGFDATLTGFDEKDLEALLTWEKPDLEPAPEPKDDVRAAGFALLLTFASAAERDAAKVTLTAGGYTVEVLDE